MYCIRLNPVQSSQSVHIVPPIANPAYPDKQFNISFHPSRQDKVNPGRQNNLDHALSLFKMAKKKNVSKVRKNIQSVHHPTTDTQDEKRKARSKLNRKKKMGQGKRKQNKKKEVEKEPLGCRSIQTISKPTMVSMARRRGGLGYI